MYNISNPKSAELTCGKTQNPKGRKMLCMLILFSCFFCFGLLFPKTAKACECKEVLAHGTRIVRGGTVYYTHPNYPLGQYTFSSRIRCKSYAKCVNGKQKRTYGQYRRITPIYWIQSGGQRTVAAGEASTFTMQASFTVNLNKYFSKAVSQQLQAKYTYTKTKYSLTALTSPHAKTGMWAACYKRAAYKYYTLKTTRYYVCKHGNIVKTESPKYYDYKVPYNDGASEQWAASANRNSLVKIFSPGVKKTDAIFNNWS